MWLVSYIVLDVIPFDRLIDERRISVRCVGLDGV